MDALDLNDILTADFKPSVTLNLSCLYKKPIKTQKWTETELEQEPLETSTPAAVQDSNWSTYNIHYKLVQKLLLQNYSNPTEIQHKTLSRVSGLKPKHFVAASETVLFILYTHSFIRVPVKLSLLLFQS
jgi:hypothetical protein